MKKIETHCHTSGVSFCSKVSATQLPRLYKTAGVNTVILTNHYSKMYMSIYGKTPNEQIGKFLKEYHTAKKAGENVGVDVWLGAEVAISTPTSEYTEFLLFGTDEEFFWKHPLLYNYSQEKLYELCRENGILMYQAHPFRAEHNHQPANPKFMDGVEINLHPDFLRRDNETVAFAKKHNLGISCGSDFHYAYQAGNGGIWIPNYINNIKELVKYMAEHKLPKRYK